MTYLAETLRTPRILVQTVNVCQPGGLNFVYAGYSTMGL